ncbi:PREDICTED: uncharacterized protein LOC104704381 [Camelina sativa]|uniref:Uncharacterized protein LOC104704381 n=1 Tax=Camelina sativa TaxID=90675 RepID=A0ABM1Q721_CAMSA|nr:PREDICTED: uncharacterized protein LOC104704381 [Camelina sativa]
MGIDGKDVCFIIWKILKISTNTTFRYVMRYPVVSGVSTFMIILYIFLPWGFYLLLCSLIAYVSYYPRNHDLSSKIDDLSEEGERTDRGLSFVSQEGRTEKAELKHQRSVRRNARRKVEEVGKDWDSSQASEDERGKVILTTLYGEVLPETISTPDLEKLKRERTLLVGEESSFDSVFDNSEDVVDPLEKVTSVDETEVECSSEEEEEEEERSEDRNKVDVVAWTEDDQKNLMDLGTSEMERNKRLENLITRRRSRRFFLLAAEGSLMDDMEVPRICIGRNFYGFGKENYEIDGLLMPGSAPSVLLPRRNPFDLPYDPLEEKPNLTGDSFQQEFAVATNSKDIFFCRHESFHHRVQPSTLQKESKLASSWRNEVDGGSRLRKQQGSNDQPPLLKEREKGNDMEAGEVRIETDSIRNDDSDSNASLSPREREKDFNVSDQSDASGTLCKQNERVGNSLAGLVPRSSGSSSLATARQRYMEHFGYNTKKCHMVTHSVDSDLQVEVSELGSPPTSVDGNDSDYERSMFVYESDIGKQMSFNGGEYEVLPVGKDDQDLNEKTSFASPKNEEAGEMESMVPQHNEASSKRPEELKELPENSADEIKISYDSDEPQPSERIDQESEETRERNDGEEMQQVMAEAEASSDVTHHGNSEESATSPRSVLPDMLLLDQTHSGDLDHTSIGELQNMDPPAESSHNQIDEHSEPTEEKVETICSDAMGTIQEKQVGSEVTYNDEPIYAEDHRQSIDPLAVELKNNQTDGIN